MRTRSITLLLAAGVTATACACAQNIQATLDPYGHRVFVNDSAPSVSAAKAPSALAPQTKDTPAARTLVYWSATEHRWKSVPPPNSQSMHRARSAAAEIARLVRQRGYEVAVRSSATPAAGAFSAVPAATAAPVISRRLRPSSDLDGIIREAAARHSVDPDLVRSVIHVESGFNASALSPKGAMGLMQLMPGTARQLQVTDPFDAAQNVDGGVRYLKDLLANNNGDIGRSLAAYNAGQKAVDRHRGIPPYKETQQYVKRITALYGHDNPFATTALPGSPSISRSRDADGHLVFSNVD